MDQSPGNIGNWSLFTCWKYWKLDFSLFHYPGKIGKLPGSTPWDLGNIVNMLAVLSHHLFLEPCSWKNDISSILKHSHVHVQNCVFLDFRHFFQSDQSLSKYAYVILFIAISTSFFEVFYSWLRVKLKSVFGNFLKELYPRLLIAFLLIFYSIGLLNFESFVLFLIYGYYLRLLIVIIYSFFITISFF